MADHTHNPCNSTGSDEDASFIDKEWEWEWEQDVQNAADTRIVSGDKFRHSVQNEPRVSADQGPVEGRCGGGGNRRGTVGIGQRVAHTSGVLVPAAVCIVERVAAAL